MTKKEILTQVFDILAHSRASANAIAEQNKQTALRYPEYANLVAKQHLLNMELGKAKFNGQDASKIKEQLQSIIAKQQKALKKIGLLPADLIPNYSCKKCGDTGIYQNQICQCASQLANNLLMQKCGIKLADVPDFADYDYKFFDDPTERQFAEKCVKTLTDYVNNLKNIMVKNVVMCGASGTGKTYLAKCIAKQLVLRGYTTLFASSFDLNNMFLEEHLSSAEQKGSLQNLIDLDCLIIDDLGTEPMRKNITKEYLLLLLNERLSKDKATIITTNLSPEQVLLRYDERIFSRIFNKRNTLILQFNGKNNRLKK